MILWLRIIEAAGVLGGAALVVWKALRFFAEMKAALDLVMTNHLPHLYDEIESVKSEVAQLRQTFVNYLAGLRG